jgi:esterase
LKLYFRKINHGKPLIILHGLFGSSDNWQTVAKIFAVNNFSVYLVDLPNHGRSPHTNEFSYPTMSNDVAELINAERINEAAIIGHSMGAKTAMQLAMDHPEKISKLIVVDMAPKYYPVHQQEILNALLSVDLDKIKTRAETEKILSEKIPDKSTLQLLLKNLYWKNDTQLAWRFNLQTINEKIENMSEAIQLNHPFTKPTLFIRGQHSDYIKPEDEPIIKELFPSAEVKTAPASGHWVHADNPAWFLESSLAFLNS